jgi:hypothetical protein
MTRRFVYVSSKISTFAPIIFLEWQDEQFWPPSDKLHYVFECERLEIFVLCKSTTLLRLLSRIEKPIFNEEQEDLGPIAPTLVNLTVC